MSQQKDAQEAQYTAILQRDPEFVRLFQEAYAARPVLGKFAQDPATLRAYTDKVQAMNQRARALGVADDFLVDAANPNIAVDHQNWFERHPQLTAGLIAGGVAGGGLAGLAFTGGGAVGAGSAATGSGATAGATPAAAAGGGIPAGEGAGTAGTTAAAGGKLAALKNFLKSPLGEALVTSGLITGGNYLEHRAQNNAIDKALAAQQAGTDKALKISGDVYNEQRRDFQNLANTPYQTLGQLLGMNIPNIGPSSAVPSGMPPGPVGPMAGQHAGDYVSGMVAPRAPLPPGFPSLAELNPPDRMTLGELVRPRTAAANASSYRKAAAR